MLKINNLKIAIDAIKFRDRILQSDIAVKLGYKNPYLSDIINGRKPISEQFTDKFCLIFGINEHWLNTGDGDMFNENQNNTTNNDQTQVYLVPLLPISAQGGSLNDFVISVKNSDCEKVISPIKGADFAMTVAGDSMAPEFPSGSMILIKRINERAFIDWGKVYVLDTCNGSIIKIVTQSNKEGHVRCESINPDQKRYAPFDVPFCEIYGIFRVMLLMSMK